MEVILERVDAAGFNFPWNNAVFLRLASDSVHEFPARFAWVRFDFQRVQVEFGQGRARRLENENSFIRTKMTIFYDTVDMPVARSYDV